MDITALLDLTIFTFSDYVTVGKIISATMVLITLTYNYKLGQYNNKAALRYCEYCILFQVGDTNLDSSNYRYTVLITYNLYIFQC